MPRAQVYGKRSRAVCSNFAIFDSPQRPTTLKPSSAEEKETARLVEKITGLSLNEYAKGIEYERRRSVLGERNANEVVSPVLPVKKARKFKAKKVPAPVEVEDVENVGIEVRNKQKQNEGHGWAVQKDQNQRDEDSMLSGAVSLHAQDADEQTLLGTGVGEPSVSGALDKDQIREADIGEATTELAKDDRLLHLEQKEDRALAGPMEDMEELDRGAHSATASQQAVSGARIREEYDTPTIVEPLPSIIPSSPQLDIYSQHCSQLLELSLHRLSDFDDWAKLLSDHFSLTKIAEASFGEVYRLSLLEQLPGLSASDESVFKVIALQPPLSALPTTKKQQAAALKKAEAMSKPDDVANEVKLLQRMSSIPGFTNFRDVRILQGRPPRLFVDAFKQYDVEQKAKRKEVSHFPDPGKKASYSEGQLWAVIEMQDAGTDLERFVEVGECTNVWGVWDVFWQVVLSLAKGEEGAQFEHRDLHLGNICVRQRSATTLASARPPSSIDVKKKLGFTNLETTIIDYTISRCLLSSATGGKKKNADIAYHDLSLDPFLFEGDSIEEYQYDIYRYMRGAVYDSDPMSYDPNPPAKPKHHRKPATPWRDYTPITNLVWLHYLLHQLLEQLEWPSARKAPARKLRGGAAHAEWKRANDLEHMLLKIQTLLDPEAGLCKNGLRSATDIVGLALTEGWLDVADVVGANGVSEIEANDELGSKEDAAQIRDGLADQLTHLVIDVDVMEEKGHEAAEKDARSRSRRPDRRRKA